MGQPHHLFRRQRPRDFGCKAQRRAPHHLWRQRTGRNSYSTLQPPSARQGCRLPHSKRLPRPSNQWQESRKRTQYRGLRQTDSLQKLIPVLLTIFRKRFPSPSSPQSASINQLKIRTRRQTSTRQINKPRRCSFGQFSRNPPTVSHLL